MRITFVMKYGQIISAKPMPTGISSPAFFPYIKKPAAKTPVINVDPVSAELFVAHPAMARGD